MHTLKIIKSGDSTFLRYSDHKGYVSLKSTASVARMNTGKTKVFGDAPGAEFITEVTVDQILEALPGVFLRVTVGGEAFYLNPGAVAGWGETPAGTLVFVAGFPYPMPVDESVDEIAAAVAGLGAASEAAKAA